MRAVIGLIDRFGDEIEYDLHAHLGMDLLDWFRGQYTWDKLVRLLGQLPWWSRYQLAHADDDEIAAEQLAREPETGPQRPGRPELSTWDPMRELRADMVDGFNALAAISAGKRKRTKPVPRPDTGRDRARRARDQATVTDLFETFAPGR